MSNLNDKDDQYQIYKNERDTENDHFYGWEIDVADTWYLYCPKTLNALDSFYADSSWRFF